jgi:ketosteroid isomerase-like protein
MVTRIALLAFLAAGVSSAADARDEVLSAEKAVSDARASNDASALDRLTSSDFLWVRPNGLIIGKKEFLDDFRAGRLGKYEFDGEQQVRIFGDAAVVTGVRVLRGREGERRIIVTNVWVRRDGRWQRVSSQTTDKQ